MINWHHKSIKMTPSTVNILDLADYVIRHSQTKNENITHLKLQKLIYYIQVWHIVYFEKHPLFDEQPEAWVNGPVYRTVYSKYKEFGNGPIILADSADKSVEYKTSLGKLKLNEKQTIYLQRVLDSYGNRSQGDLILRTHQERPWNEARKGLGVLDYSTAKITYQMMLEYYSQVVEKNKN